ncbi:transcription factor bHLH125-like [Coffea eugenioides]|uniref:transcription factor bHLH125-like n=1 Tax=Coffea eugenioides TaxID=49369 RepID=UPI000F60F642|nr:transcription factor bHLH125-like [Coffea eugenioides]XP_027157903.1 transcription factor bHLH125-like [Coffea eugenioides]
MALDTKEIIINTKFNSARKRQRKPLSAIRVDNHDCGKNPNANQQKKAHHRDIERQRRQETARLYASLRNLLPLECKQRKHSVSDHVLQAANHIEHMEKNIKKLEVKKDKLRNLTGGLIHLEVKNVEETKLSCVYTKFNEEFLYTIQSEANADVDPICLQEKLTKKIII